jgi:hypothetical protein
MANKMETVSTTAQMLVSACATPLMLTPVAAASGGPARGTWVLITLNGGFGVTAAHAGAAAPRAPTATARRKTCTSSRS